MNQHQLAFGATRRAGIDEGECRYRCWLLTRDDPVAGRALMVLRLDDTKPWADHLAALVYLLGETETARRLGCELAG